ncbi:MAG: HEAT repeat domain-containing protein [Deltaproteobacteria bacterium]|nr:HEAT repeat domain-containing protein [Deltaproteobacteria bacterium]
MSAASGHDHRRAAMGLAIAALVAFVAGPTRAHVVYGTPTLSRLTQDSDLVLSVRIIEPSSDLPLPDSSAREVVVVAEVLELLKGSYAKERVAFVQHGHGSPEYEKGDEVAVFLKRIERSPELRRGAVASRIHWVSEQEAGNRFALNGRVRPDFLEAVRAYAQLAALAPEARPKAMHRITLELLASPHPKLASSALRDLVIAGNASLLGARDLPALEPLLMSPATSIGIRIGLLVELERRALIDGPPRWAKLLRTTTGKDRLNAVRASAAHPSEPVTNELVALLANDDSQLVSAVAVALGAPGNDAAIAPLAKLLESDESRVRMAAIRGLGRVATPRARQVLVNTAAAHPDAATRRRARAEAQLLDRQTTSAGAVPDRGSSLQR